MSFFGLLLLFLLFIILRPIIRVAYKLWSLRRQVRDAYRQAYGYTEPKREYNSSRQKAEAPRRRGRRIPADYGEYIDYEEIEYVPPGPLVKYKRQQQISDAEWEEIK